MGGIQRSLNFCRYLPKFKWKPIVLTVKDIKYFTQDKNLLDEVTCKVYRSESLDPLRVLHKVKSSEFKSIKKKYQKLSDFFFVPDNKIGWLYYAVKLGIKIVKAENIDVVFASAPPYTSLLAGYLIAKAKNKPLVCEFRDPWPYYTDYPTIFHRKINEYLKRKALSKSIKVITVNEAIKLDLVNSKIPENKIIVMPAGYSPDDFNISTKVHGKQSNRFTITYTGSFVPPRTPVYFLKAIAELVQEKKLSPEEFKLELVGLPTEEEIKTIKELNLEKIVNLTSYLPHKGSIKKLIEADVLWVMMGEGEKIALPGKMGEYLGARKPILATIPAEGPCANVIRQTKAGVIVPPTDIPAVKSAIYNFYLQFKENKLFSITPQVDEFSYVALTKKLAEIFNSSQN